MATPSKESLIRKGITTVTTKTTKPQTGLSISRTGYNAYSFGWKLGQTYDSQKLGYTTHGASAWRSYTYLDITKGQTKKSITIDRTQYYPIKSAYCNGIRLALKATGTGTIDSKKKKATVFTTCDWVRKDITIYKPRTPSITTTLDETLTNKCKFEWSVADSGSDSLYVFHDVEWESILVKDSPSSLSEDTWSTSTKTKNTGGASGEQSFTEDTVTLASGSYTRWFRCRSRGMAGTNGWKTDYHVYARPKQAKIDMKTLKASTTDAGGFQCYCKWTADSDFAHPIDQTTVQYVITVPDTNLSCPNGASWSDANVSGDTSGFDAVTFSIDDLLSEDQCLFVRVNTLHDSNITYGSPALAEKGKLKTPSAPDVNISTATHNATIECTNNSDVPDSFVVISFQMGNDPSNIFDIGIIPHDSDSDSVTVQCPDWGDNSIAFIARAVVGTYRPVERPDGADCYVVTPKMESDNTSYEAGSIPTAPTGVTATATETTGTVRIEWEWSWSGARAAELSWADHYDAWMSTDEPDTYVVSNVNAPMWNVAGLAIGKRWYFRVRLMCL